MKKFIVLLLAVLAISLSAKAQIYDGITQPTTYRVWASISQPTNGDNASFSFFTGYKYDVCKWFNVTGVANYNVTSRAFSPSLWLNFNIGGVFYILSRNTYDINGGAFKETLSASVKIPKGFMIDATWDNLLVNDKFCEADRLQVVAGWGNQFVIFNAGYSMRHKQGVVANIRFKLTPSYWLQFKYDGGIDAVAVNMAYHF